MTFEELNIKPVDDMKRSITIGGDIKLDIVQYLPIKDKADLITYIVDNAVDEMTGCFSPVRLNVYYSLAIVKWYAGVDISAVDDVPSVYDMLEQNNIINMILAEIPEEERNYMSKLIDDTVEDISRYNNSFAGMVSNISSEANVLDKSVSDLLEKFRSKENLEVFNSVKDMIN